MHNDKKNQLKHFNTIMSSMAIAGCAAIWCWTHPQETQNALEWVDAKAENVADIVIKTIKGSLEADDLKPVDSARLDTLRLK